jgi:hypothetical protein
MTGPSLPSPETQTIDMGASMETLEALDIIDALNEVSDVQAMAGSEVTFTGTRVAAAGEGAAGAEAYRCPRGWFILLKSGEGAHRCVTGATLIDALASVDDPDLRAALAGGDSAS